MIPYIKKAINILSYVLTVLVLASCSNNQRPMDTREVAKEKNEAKFDNENQKKDSEFLVNAAAMNLNEIQLGLLSQQKAKSKDVKNLGKIMVDYHTKSLNDLTALAKIKMITIPNSPTDYGQDTYQTLNEKSGNDFDLAYADIMVRAHKDAIVIFENASSECDDEDIRNWASGSLPVLRTHLEYSVESQNKLVELLIPNK
jgi:putative membrane protein